MYSNPCPPPPPLDKGTTDIKVDKNKKLIRTFTQPFIADWPHNSINFWSSKRHFTLKNIYNNDNRNMGPREERELGPRAGGSAMHACMTIGLIRKPLLHCFIFFYLRSLPPDPPLVLFWHFWRIHFLEYVKGWITLEEEVMSRGYVFFINKYQ